MKHIKYPFISFVLVLVPYLLLAETIHFSYDRTNGLMVHKGSVDVTWLLKNVHTQTYEPISSPLKLEASPKHQLIVRFSNLNFETQIHQSYQLGILSQPTKSLKCQDNHQVLEIGRNIDFIYSVIGEERGNIQFIFTPKNKKGKGRWHSFTGFPPKPYVITSHRETPQTSKKPVISLKEKSFLPTSPHTSPASSLKDESNNWDEHTSLQEYYDFIDHYPTSIYVPTAKQKIYEYTKKEILLTQVQDTFYIDLPNIREPQLSLSPFQYPIRKSSASRYWVNIQEKEVFELRIEWLGYDTTLVLDNGIKPLGGDLIEENQRWRINIRGGIPPYYIRFFPPNQSYYTYELPIGLEPTYDLASNNLPNHVQGSFTLHLIDSRRTEVFSLGNIYIKQPLVGSTLIGLLIGLLILILGGGVYAYRKYALPDDDSYDEEEIYYFEEDEEELPTPKEDAPSIEQPDTSLSDNPKSHD